MRTRDVLLGAWLMLAATTAVSADNPREIARAHYARGVDLAEMSRYGEALQEFNQAYIVSPEFAVLYNIGQCHIALGDATQAVEALSRYLRDGAARIPPERRELVRQQIDMLATRPPSDAQPAAGAAAGARETARARVALGSALASHNQYGAALKEFVDAYTTDPEVGILYNIGQCHVALGHPVDAIEAFSKYLRDGADQIPPGRGDLLETQIAMLESRLAELTILTVGPEARVEIDGHDLGRTPLTHPLRLGAGDHRVTFAPDAGPLVQREIVLIEAQRLTLSVRLPFLPASWSAATAARVAASSKAAARGAEAAALANEQAIVEKVRAASSQQGAASK